MRSAWSTASGKATSEGRRASGSCTAAGTCVVREELAGPAAAPAKAAAAVLGWAGNGMVGNRRRAGGAATTGSGIVAWRWRVGAESDTVAWNVGTRSAVVATPGAGVGEGAGAGGASVGAKARGVSGMACAWRCCGGDSACPRKTIAGWSSSTAAPEPGRSKATARGGSIHEGGCGDQHCQDFSIMWWVLGCQGANLVPTSDLSDTVVVIACVWVMPAGMSFATSYIS